MLSEESLQEIAGKIDEALASLERVEAEERPPEYTARLESAKANAREAVRLLTDSN